MHPDTFGARSKKTVGGHAYGIFLLEALETGRVGKISRLPFSIKVLLENLLRHEDGVTVTADDIRALANWSPKVASDREIAFRPARVLLQDFTGVPALVDLAAMRDAAKRMGGDPKRVNPLMPADLVIDHSVQVDRFAAATAFPDNVAREYGRNGERYAFLRWGKESFRNFRVVPPGTGICHQVNLEYLAPVVFTRKDRSGALAYPDTLVGTDSHTPMINGLGVVGWGVGGIEAEAAMLGQPISMLIPEVVGFRMTGELPVGATATDLVLTVVQMLRKKGVVGKFVEFYGKGLSSLSVADRATISNMSPEYGATIGFFPVDRETLSYLLFTGRDREQVKLVEAYCKAQGLFRTDETRAPAFSDTLSLDLSTVEPCMAGPRRPQDRVPLKEARDAFRKALSTWGKEARTEDGADGADRWMGEGGYAAGEIHPPEAGGWTPGTTSVRLDQGVYDLHDGSVVIAAITSCTNTSNPSVMIGAGLVAKKAVEKGLRTRPWVKTSLAPGSMVVTEYLTEAGLLPCFEALGFHVVGYGCTTCIGNSGPLPTEISEAIREHDVIACSVLSGNRNFEGRISPDSRANYLASPPLVVAYALAGRMDIDLYHEPLATNEAGEDVYLRDLWPTQEEIRETVRAAVKPEMFKEKYAGVYAGDERWNSLDVPTGSRFAWDPGSTYVRQPTFFEGMTPDMPPLEDIEDARCLALLGDSVTTDHISPAGSIARESPAGEYLREHGVPLAEFNSYGSRRGNHEVMMRGTFANIRLRNRMVPGVEGGYTRHVPSGERMTIFDAAMRYAGEGTPLIVIGGREYGSGSSRDWAAKGPYLLGVRAVIAVSYERIHRSNLIGMGVLPLQFRTAESPESLGLDGSETYRVEGIADGIEPEDEVRVTATRDDGSRVEFAVIARLDTEVEVDYYRNGGILQTVLRQELRSLT